MENHFVELIQKKRDGIELTQKEIDRIVFEYTGNRIPDYQLSAFLMAVYFQGMSARETYHLTQALLKSGESIDLSDIPGPKVDKHSTGGVGDKISLLVAPIVAAAGVNVPMISGRGLGHTGGTLDKLESIPGFTTRFSVNEFKDCLKKTGACLIGQTEAIVPADKKIYALRDVTGTIPSIPLITSSIMSKKLAEGADALVLDVKVGRGAFFSRRWDALQLARSLVDTGKLAGIKVVAVLTDMNEPLGSAVGNWVEVKEAVETLQGNGREDILELSLALAGEMIFLADKTKKPIQARKISEEILRSGAAWKKFKEIIQAQKGDIRVFDDLSKTNRPSHELDVLSRTNGFIQTIDAYRVGILANHLGAGRTKKEDDVDPTAGIWFYRKQGDMIKKSEPIARIMTSREVDLELAGRDLLESIKISRKKIRKKKTLLGRIH